jgi:hypothetical protein
MLPDLIERHAWRLHPYRHWLFWLPIGAIAIGYQLERLGIVSTSPPHLVGRVLAGGCLWLFGLAFSAFYFPAGRGTLSPLVTPNRPRGPWLHFKRWAASLFILVLLCFPVWTLGAAMIRLLRNGS